MILGIVLCPSLGSSQQLAKWNRLCALLTPGGVMGRMSGMMRQHGNGSLGGLVVGPGDPGLGIVLGGHHGMGGRLLIGMGVGRTTRSFWSW